MPGWLVAVVAFWEKAEVHRWLLLTSAGVLGAVISLTLDAKALVLPSVRARRVELGSAGQILACVLAAHFVDHDFQTAFLGSLCGVSALRHIRARIQATFEHEIRGLSTVEGHDGSHD